MAGAPIGNQNAKEGRIWRDALRRALLADDGKRLRKIADALVDKAEEGDVAAIREIGDRMDGKAAQTLAIGGDPDGTPLWVATINVMPVAVERTDG
jgi:hypothetical protein